MIDWTLRDEWQLDAVNIPRASLLIARELAYPDLDVAAYVGRLGYLAELAADRVPPQAPLLEQAERLSEFLFDTLGFAGDESDYADPRNSYLNEVLDRRLGLPITLSVVYVDIATRLGLPAYGIGLPGHFIVGVRAGDDAHWLDPFYGGRWLTLNDCAELIYLSTGFEGPLDAAWFLPALDRDILTRMVHNLRGTYVRRQAWSQAAAAIRMLRLMQPESAEHLRDLGLVYFRQQSLPQAAYFLNEYLSHAPQASDAAMIREGLKQPLDEWVLLN